MNQFIDDFYDILFKPANGVSRIVAQRSAWHGLLVYLSVSLISAMAGFVAVDLRNIAEELSGVMPQEAVDLFLQSMPLLNVIAILVFSPIILFAWSAILQFSSELLGGQGRGFSLAAGIGYAQMPYIIMAPLGLISRYLPMNIMGFAGFAVFVWSFLLKIESIRAVHKFSKRRAVLAYFLPLLATVGASIIFFLLLGAFLMPLLSELYPL